MASGYGPRGVRERDGREPSYDGDRRPSPDRGRDRGGGRDDYERGRDRELQGRRTDPEQGQPDYDEWDRDAEYKERDRDPPDTRGGSNRPGYDRRPSHDRDGDRGGDRGGYGSRDGRERSRGRGDGGRDGYQGRDDRDRPAYDRDRPGYHDRDRAKPDFSKHRSSSIAEIASGMSERQEFKRCACTLWPLASAEAACPTGRRWRA